MRNEHVLNELSAYLDGEAKDPEAIRRHLQQCPSCARRYMELSKVSSHIKALRAPEVHPAFVTRVLAEVAETRQAGAVWRWLGISAALAAAVVFVAGIVRFAYTPRDNDVERVAVKNVDTGQILEEIERRVASGEDVYEDFPVVQEEGTAFLVSSLASERNVEGLAPREIGADEFVEAIVMGAVLAEGSNADSVAEMDAAGTWMPAGAWAPAASIDELDESEKAAFKQLLIEYAMEGATS